MALRLIARLFKNRSYEHVSQLFPQQLTELRASLLIQPTVASLTQILKTWQKHHSKEYAAVVLHFDEINYLQETGREYLVGYIGAAMTLRSSEISENPSVAILPLLTGITGSIIDTITVSKFGHIPLSLSALNDEAQNTLVLGTVEKNLRLKLQEDNKFKKMIKSTLGVPRIVMQLRRAVLEELDGEITSRSDLLAAIGVKFLKYVGQTYIMTTWRKTFPSDDLLMRFICVCLRGKFASDIEEDEEKGTREVATITVPGIDEEMTHIPGMRMSVHGLRDGGFIHTTETFDTNRRVDILLPYSVLSSLISSAPQYDSIQSSIIAPIANLTWQELEELELNFLKLLVRAFNAMRPRLYVKFRANPFNGKSESIGSAKDANKARKTDSTMKLLNLVQMKASADPKATITASQIYTWYWNAQQLTFPEDFHVVFSYFTNKNMEWDSDANDVQWTEKTLLASCPKLVLMAREQLETYLSPMFAPQCLEDNLRNQQPVRQEEM